jgi:ABC-type antimicrobial peptide transport system permease subunit
VKPELFLSIGPFPVRAVTIVMQPVSGPDDALAALRGALREVDPLVPISAVGTLELAAREVVSGPRTYAALVTGFAGLALLLAGIGVYGVMACAVVERQREIGVRLALGATAGDIRRLVLGDGARLALAGVAAGVVGAALTTRLIRSQLFETSALDPATYAAVPALLAGLALVAAWLPARRATRIDPLSVMRAE